jgi:probable HAF family extracellular repeat protein
MEATMRGFLTGGRPAPLHPAGGLLRLAAVGVAVLATLLGAAPASAAPASAAPAASAVEPYQVVDLGTLPGGSFSAASAVNERGEVVGQSDGRAVLWRNGQTFAIGPVGSAAVDISELGEVVGATSGADGNRAFRWQGGESTELAPLPGDTDSLALGVNDRGQVVGLSFGPTAASPVLWGPDDVPVNLGESTKLVRADDLNNTGTFVGEVDNGVGTAPAIATAVRTTPLSARSGAASDINASGEVTGYFFDGTHGSYTWLNGQLTEIPLLPGAIAMQAQAINNRGVVVGFSQSQGFRWDGAKLITLPGLSGPMTAQDINDRGWIAGTSTASNGNSHAVLLLPR